MRKFRSTPLHALLAAAVLGLLVMPLAFAGAQAPKAQSSAVVTAAKFKQLKKRIAALEGKGTPAQGAALPTGPAGGDLTGTYPNPTIAQNAVGSAEVQADSLAAADLAPNSVGTSEVADQSLTVSDIGADAVGADELKATYVNVTGGVEVDANQFGDQQAQCNGSDQALGGGHSWLLQNAETHIVHSTPDPLVQPNKWNVRGSSEVNDNVLFAWVVCINA